MTATKGIRLSVLGLEREVEVLRDRSGVVHIYAHSQNDLFCAQGYMAAHDRLWQIDYWRRTGKGLLSELIGEAGLASDTLARQVNYESDWEREWAAYSPGTKGAVYAFTRGINSFVASVQGHVPAEFKVAGCLPSYWTPEDCLLRAPSLRLGRGVALKYQRGMDVQAFGTEAVSRTLPRESGYLASFNREQLTEALDAGFLKAWQAAIQPPVIGGPEGSNAWAVSASRTNSGRPILASDPHRRVEIPPTRKTFHLIAPGINAIGASDPWFPGISIGHNESIAYGFTTTGADQQDLLICRTDKDHAPGFYRAHWSTELRIPVRGRAAHKAEVKYTSEGPVVFEDEARQVAYILKSVGSEAGAAAYAGGLGLMTATNWGQFLDALSYWKAPVQQFIYADIHGNIGSKVAGAVPVRSNGSGLLPSVLTSDMPVAPWSRFRKFSALPMEFNPASGIVASANNWIYEDDGNDGLLLQYCSAPFRYNRIVEVLNNNATVDVSLCAQLQCDIKSLAAERFVSLIAVHREHLNARARQVVDEFVRWDKTLGKDSLTATIYEFTIAALASDLFGPELRRRTHVTALLFEVQEVSAERVESAILSALTSLEADLGPRGHLWAWGNIHQVVFRHSLPELEWNRGPFAAAGDAETVSATAWDSSTSGHEQGFGASYRQVIDCGDWDASRMLNVPGESGNPASPFYSNMIQASTLGVYCPLLFSRGAVESDAIERIILFPELS